MRKKISFLIIAAVLLLGIAGCSASTDGNTDGKQPEAEGLCVTFIDTADSDSILLATGGGTILIDTGLEVTYPSVRSALLAAGVKKIDILVITHPHKDHVGGGDRLLADFEVDVVYMPKTDYRAAQFDAFTEALNKTKVPVKDAGPGVTFELDGMKGEFLGPLPLEAPDENNESAVLRLKYGEKVFLFMGDAEKEEEEELLSAFGTEKLRADVLKVGHHGAKDASKKSFLAKVRPKIAVITGNPSVDDTHANSKTISRLENAGATVYGTYQNGTVAVLCDGKEISVVTEK